MGRAGKGATLELTRNDAVRIAYTARFAPTAARSGPQDARERAADQLERLGHVQIDTISVVERAHHHVLWGGDRLYAPGVLPLLEATPRLAFEYWAHAAAYLPIGDYRYCLPRMRRIAETGHEWFPTERRTVDAVLDRIRAEGPLRARDFEGGDGPRGPWWDWKPAKAALEYLFMSGVLLVASRPGFQKLYDLAERVLPPGLDARFPSAEETGDWYVRRTALSYGVFSEADVAYMRKDGRGGVREALDRAAESGTIRRAAVEGDAGRDQWASVSALEAASPGKAPEDGRPVRILSPFDNYLIDRKRAKRILGFDYTLECYVPRAKRKFGYFALPVIWRGEPVGLVDAAADRKSRRLVVKRVEFRFGSDAPEGFRETFDVELGAFAAFNGCETTAHA